MVFATSVELPTDLPRFSQADHLMLLGSCFASEMGSKLVNVGFSCDMNPYGVLYNPFSISTALREISAGKEYTLQELFFHEGCWHSLMHHSDFSFPGAEDTLLHVNSRLKKAYDELDSLQMLLFTWGTAYVYEEKSNGKIVGNCHKLPETHFIRRMLSVEEIVSEYTVVLSDLFAEHPQLKVIFTVSPIRHVRDGMHANQLSKSTLLLAINGLQTAFPGRISYFPAYELMMDELRDYRFYAEDMVHPSAVAVNYIWECFAKTCFTSEALEIMEEIEKIDKALSHKPFHPDSEQYKRFLEQIVLKIERLNEKYPYLDFQKEKEICYTRLKK